MESSLKSLFLIISIHLTWLVILLTNIHLSSCEWLTAVLRASDCPMLELLCSCVFDNFCISNALYYMKNVVEFHVLLLRLESIMYIPLVQICCKKWCLKWGNCVLLYQVQETVWSAARGALVMVISLLGLNFKNNVAYYKEHLEIFFFLARLCTRPPKLISWKLWVQFNLYEKIYLLFQNCCWKILTGIVLVMWKKVHIDEIMNLVKN